MTWMWLIWWAVAIGLFAIFEGYAIDHPNRQWTLSHTMAYVGAKFPLSIGLLGMLFGGLLVHFYWHFCPAGVPEALMWRDLPALRAGTLPTCEIQRGDILVCNGYSYTTTED